MTYSAAVRFREWIDSDPDCRRSLDELAMEMGIDESNIIVGETGRVIELSSGNAKCGIRDPAGRVPDPAASGTDRASDLRNGFEYERDRRRGGDRPYILSQPVDPEILSYHSAGIVPEIAQLIIIKKSLPISSGSVFPDPEMLFSREQNSVRTARLHEADQYFALVVISVST